MTKFWNNPSATLAVALTLALGGLPIICPAPALAAASKATSKTAAVQNAKSGKAAPKQGALKKGKKTEDSAAAEIDLSGLSSETQRELQRLSEALHLEDRAIYNELRDQEELSVKDLAMLWQAAVERSGTIRFAIEKLSRRDATGKPVANDSFTKRILQSVARVGGVAGSMWTGSPAGLLGGNLVEEMLHSDPTEGFNTRITDADMLILAKEIEVLQSQLMEAYYTYCHNQEQWKLAQESTRTLDRYYKRVMDTAATNSARQAEQQALAPIVESLFETAQRDEFTAKQAFISSRNALGQMVGGDALIALEKVRDENARAHQSGSTENDSSN